MLPHFSPLPQLLPNPNQHNRNTAYQNGEGSGALVYPTRSHPLNIPPPIILTLRLVCVYTFLTDISVRHSLPILSILCVPLH